ncbi:hypothetical protein AGMMS49992_31630 [Clostridia bacterium]|nr:hypothetical protein AGMMS49992_31630 [Clostridia bacterium]
MSISLDLSTPHRIAAAYAHYYREPTPVLYIDRVMPLHDFIYMVDGSWSITENDTEYLLEKNDVLMLSAGRHHYTRLPSLPETRTICIHVTCTPQDNTDGAVGVTLPTMMSIRGSTKTKTYFEEIVSTFWSDNPHKQEKLSALFDLVVCELADLETSGDAKRPDIAAEAVRMINAAPHRTFKLGEAAEILYVSGRTLENAMQRATGMSFAEYQMNRKLEITASQLLIEPYIKLKEIAATLGFYDEFHLSKAFKRKYGVSPKVYKQVFPKDAASSDDTNDG